MTNDLQPPPLLSSAVTILIPTLNEAGSIGRLLNSIPPDYTDCVLVVDGGSTDGTLDIVRQLGFRSIRQDARGLGNAILTGVRNTSGEVIVTLDADGAHDGTHCLLMLRKIQEGFDLVVASRFSPVPDAPAVSRARREPRPDGIVRGFGNWFFTWLCRIAFDVPLTDVLNGCKAFRRQMLDTVQIERPGQEYDVEIVLKAQAAGFRLGEVAIDQGPRLAGVSKLNVSYHGALILMVIGSAFLRKPRRARHPRRVPSQARTAPAIQWKTKGNE